MKSRSQRPAEERQARSRAVQHITAPKEYCVSKHGFPRMSIHRLRHRGNRLGTKAALTIQRRHRLAFD